MHEFVMLFILSYILGIHFTVSPVGLVSRRVGSVGVMIVFGVFGVCGRV